METRLPHQTAVLDLRGEGASSPSSRVLERIGVHVSIDTLRRRCARHSSGGSYASAKAQPARLPFPQRGEPAGTLTGSPLTMRSPELVPVSWTHG